MFLDYRKAFDLINRNVLLENFMQIGVRLAVVGWFASYLYNTLQAEFPDYCIFGDKLLTMLFVVLCLLDDTNDDLAPKMQ